jgi:hypothetical protein
VKLCNDLRLGRPGKGDGLLILLLTEERTLAARTHSAPNPHPIRTRSAVRERRLSFHRAGCALRATLVFARVRHQSSQKKTRRAAIRGQRSGAQGGAAYDHQLRSPIAVTRAFLALSE